MVLEKIPMVFGDRKKIPMVFVSYGLKTLNDTLIEGLENNLRAI